MESVVWSWIIFGTLLVGLLIYSVFSERRRRKRLEEWAERTGFTAYEASEELGWLRGYEAWGPGGSHRAFDGYRGTVDGRPVSVFQHRSTTSNGKSSTTHDFAVCVMETRLSAESLTIKPEHLGHKLIDALGAEDIDFESAEFSKKFWVKCKDRKFAYDVLHPQMMEWLLDAPRWNWQWKGHRLVVVRSGSLKVPVIKDAIRSLRTFRSRIPRHLEPS